jgi:lysophospholipase L1-like esterase
MRTPSALLLACLLALPAFAADGAKPAPKSETKPAVRKPLAEQPLRMAKDIAAFEAQDKANPPPQQALLLSGASSLRMWKNVDEAMKPYPVINRGFGGSYTTEVLGYMDRITLPYHPRVVVFHCGGNDVNAGDPAEAPLGRIREYVKRLRKDNPETAVVFMATTRAPSRKAKWPELDKFNAGLAAYCKEETKVWFVDINPALNQPSGEGKEGHYLKDNLHPSELGYQEIAKVLKPAVDAAWKATEKAFKK